MLGVGAGLSCSHSIVFCYLSAKPLDCRVTNRRLPEVRRGDLARSSP